MNPKDASFTAYDFLGYLFPGMACLFLIDFGIAAHHPGFQFTEDFFLNRYGKLDWSTLVPLMVFGYFTGHMVSFFSSLTIEKYAIWAYGHPKNCLFSLSSKKYFNVTGRTDFIALLFFRLPVFVFMLPVAIFDIIFVDILKLRKNLTIPFDDLVGKALRDSVDIILKRMGIKNPAQHGKAKDNHFDKLVLHYCLEAAPNHVYSLRNYVVLYGFLRSSAFLVMLIFWTIVAHEVFWNLSPVNHWRIAIIVGSAIFAFSVYYNYYKFFYRYHEEMFLAAAAAIGAIGSGNADAS